VSSPPDPGERSNYVSYSKSFIKQKLEMNGAVQFPIKDDSKKFDLFYNKNLSSIYCEGDKRVLELLISREYDRFGFVRGKR